MKLPWIWMKTPSHKIVLAFALIALFLPVFAADPSLLKPPPGSRVAIVMFEDLECPDCARAYPVVFEAAKAHGVPVVLHDFPLNNHPWSMNAAIFARYFDTKSEKLGNDFRGYIFQNQNMITKQNVRQYAEKFGNDNKAPFPFTYDPENKLKENVLADRDLGTRIGLEHTPTIFIVSNTNAVEVTDRSQLTSMLEDMIAKNPPPPAAKNAAPKKGAAKKSPKP